MGLQLGTQAKPAPDRSHEISVVSCNISQDRGNLHCVVERALERQPDLVCLQECNGVEDELRAYFTDWYCVSRGEFFVASKFPLLLGPACMPFRTNHPTFADWSGHPDFDYLRRRMTAIAMHVATPSGNVSLFNVHLQSPRRRLQRLTWEQVSSSDSLREFKQEQLIMAEESMFTRAFVLQHRGDQPYLVVGDFNMCCENSFYKQDWGDLNNSYSLAGFGYGYTALCYGVDIWFDNAPWLRIDHILFSSDWQVSHADVFDSGGSDHRLIWAKLWSRTKEDSPPVGDVENFTTSDCSFGNNLEESVLSNKFLTKGPV
jgi:endonuclease/exonuclease/phosphatase family metal-dependent hydrolase